MRTQVGIIGAGPAGLMLGRLLELQGIDSVIVETRSRAALESRVRAGMIEHWAADLMTEVGAGVRMAREGLLQWGLKIGVNGALHRIDFKHEINRRITIYGQQELVKDLIEMRLGSGAPLLFETEAAGLDGLATERPSIRLRDSEVIDCDFVAGCDGARGISVASLPEGAVTRYAMTYPFSWLGILAAAPPPDEELIYAASPQGFALASMRSPTLARLYLQCTPGDDVAQWPDARIWDELQARIGPSRSFEDGEILHKDIAPVRSGVVEPMQHGRLFLAGNAAHVLPPTGAKSVNLALADALVLSRALAGFYRDGRRDLLESYSATCLRRVWEVQRFAFAMTDVLHLFPDDSPFARRRRLAALEHLVGSPTAARGLAEDYVGLSSPCVRLGDY